MSNNLADWRNYELLPAMAEKLDDLLPEFEFKRIGDKWVSSYHLNGTKSAHSKDQVFCYCNSLILQDNGTVEKIGVIDFIAKKQNLPTTYTQGGVFEYIANTLGLSFPSKTLTPQQIQELEQKQQAITEREKANEDFCKALFDATNPEAVKVLQYLTDVRKWTKDEIITAEFGYFDRQKTQYFDAVEVNNKAIGTSHKLSIPVRNTAGDLVGFKFRTIDNSVKEKYYNTFGLSKETFFGYLSKSSPVVIVEGEFDALTAKAKGLNNVVASLGGSASESQIKDAIRRGYKQFICLYDNDEHGREFAVKTLDLVEKYNGVAFVATIPEASKDLDEYLHKGHSKEDAEKIIKANKPAFKARFETLQTKYQAMRESAGNGEISAENREILANDLKELYKKTRQIDRPLLLSDEDVKQFADTLKIDLSTLQNIASDEAEREKEKEQAKKIERLSKELADLVSNGRMAETVNLAGEIAKIKQDTGEQYAEEFQPLRQSLSSLIAETPKGVPTEFAFNYYDEATGKQTEPFELSPSLSMVCAPTSHGKTSFLNNVCLNLVEKNRKEKNGEKVIYFSLEVSKPRLVASLLNTYCNDANLSKINKPLNAILDECKGHGDGFFNTGHFQPYKEKKKGFEQILQNGDLIITDQQHTGDDLAKSVEWYCEQVQRPSAVFIDYAQLLYLEEEKGQTRTEEIKQILKLLKDIANKKGVPIVLACQMKNEVKSPLDCIINNIGESKDISFIAEQVIVLFNLAKLQDLTNKDDLKQKDLLKKLLEKYKRDNPNTDKEGQINAYIEQKEGANLRGLIYAKLVKNRFGASDLEELFCFEQRTGKIWQEKETRGGGQATLSLQVEPLNKYNNTDEF